MRLIDANKIIEPRRKTKYYHLPNGDTAIPIIDIEHAPTVDAVPFDKLCEWLAANECDPSCRVCEYYEDSLCVHTDIPCGSKEHWRLILTKWMKGLEPPKDGG